MILLKWKCENFLVNKNVSIFDVGPYNNQSVDYPDYAKKIAKRVASKRSDIGILVCGSGTGMAISANKTKGIRAAVCYNAKSTRLSREHNNANILSIGARFISAEKVHTIIDIWLGEAFAGGRHEKRIKKLDDL